MWGLNSQQRSISALILTQQSLGGEKHGKPKELFLGCVWASGGGFQINRLLIKEQAQNVNSKTHQSNSHIQPKMKLKGKTKH